MASEIIEEVRHLLENGAHISAQAASRLTLALLVDIKNDQEEASKNQKKILENPMVRFGFFWKEHPKRVILWGVGLFMAINAWFVSGWRQPILKGILTTLGFPPEVVDMVP